MDAETLIGRQLGTSTLQRVIGTGTMGAVYLAHQAQPPHQVAVKVFLRLATLEPQQQREFLAAFRDEMGRAFSLEHPNIVGIYDYGDLDGLAYIMTPFIAGETLEDMLTREGALSLQTAANYLQQIASALNYAHSQGIVHRDLKPANIFITPEKKVLVADFHLTSMLIEGKTAQMRLSKPGLLDYMSPELVVGKHIDSRADQYSLGAILFRMVTGISPFQGQTLMKVATKHLKMPPPSPRAARPDLPPAVEQVILKALAKNPADRFANILDMPLLFQKAINGPAMPHITSQELPPLPIKPAFFGGAFTSPVPAVPDAASSDTGARPFAPSPLFGPNWRDSSRTALAASQNEGSTGAMNMPTIGTPFDAMHPSSASLPSLASTGTFSMLNGQPPSPTTSRDLTSGQNAVQMNPLAPFNATQTPSQALMAPGHKTGFLPEINQDDSGTTGTFKLTGPARIVNIPVAGQPGHYVTGILPASQQPTSSLPMGVAGMPAAPVKRPFLRRYRVPIFALAALLIVCGSLGFVFIHFASSKHPTSSTTTPGGTPNIAATATARAQASVDANTIYSDSLSQNIRSWPESSNGPVLYQFKDGAYHITNNDPTRVATAILPGENLSQPFVYTLTMDEVRGDDTSVNNESGMILRFNTQMKNGKQIITFYTFEVVNNKGGAYQFWKYDNSQGASVDPWKQIANHPFGSEFHQGQGPANSNTFKILVNGKNFTLIVNGKQVWSVQDSSFISGQVGMLVNLKGTEVAFSNLSLTLS
ncbi:MAG TPA: protein kinase [Ktedonobacteraceae bacterium]|nr:protein kinase [Ktedonobacteraceae bacterium]